MQRGRIPPAAAAAARPTDTDRSGTALPLLGGHRIPSVRPSSRPSRNRSTPPASHRARCSTTPAPYDTSRSNPGRHLPGQIVIPGPRCELVHAHRHTHPKGYRPPRRSCRPELLPTVGLYVASPVEDVSQMCEGAWGYEWGYVAERWVWSNAAAKSRVRGWKLCHAACLQAVSRASFASTAPTPAGIDQARQVSRSGAAAAPVASWRMVANTMSDNRRFKQRRASRFVLPAARLSSWSARPRCRRGSG